MARQELSEGSQFFILFGLPGSGKDFVAKVFEDDFDFVFYEGDQLFTQGMKEYLSLGKVVTPQIKREYLDVLIDKIRSLRSKFPKVVVTEALFKEDERQLLATNFPDARFILIETTQEIREQRIDQRVQIAKKELSKNAYKFFEQPKSSCLKILNISDRVAVQGQIKRILEKCNIAADKFQPV